MKFVCEKCKTYDERGSLFVEGGESHRLCKLCSIVVEKQPLGNRVHDFLYDKSDLSRVDRSMIDARIRRAAGQFMWQDKTYLNGDNKGQGYAV